jgi:hypothetical protein
MTMTDNKYLAWTSFILFVLSLGIILLFLFLATMFSDLIENPGLIILVVGVFSLLGAIMGFLSFKAPQAKVGGIGGLLILLLVLFVIPIGRETTMTPPQPDINFQEQTGHTGIAEIDHIIDTVLAGNPRDETQLLQFATLGCTHADGLGGPPKCKEDEEEGTPVEVFPFLGPEGHHMRRDEADGWSGIQASDVYAVYRVPPAVYSDEAYPAGEYAIVFLIENEEYYLTTQVTDGKIVRIDNGFGNPADVDLEQVASEIILAPKK